MSAVVFLHSYRAAHKDRRSDCWLDWDGREMGLDASDGANAPRRVLWEAGRAVVIPVVLILAVQAALSLF
jgi:hypothetical protein